MMEGGWGGGVPRENRSLAQEKTLEGMRDEPLGDFIGSYEKSQKQASQLCAS